MKCSTKANLRKRVSSSIPVRFADCPHIFPRILLFWLQASCPIYHRVSSNVLREVAVFLWFIPRLTSSTEAGVWSLDPVAKQWRLDCSLDSSFSVIDAIGISENRVFCACWVHNCVDSFLIEHSSAAILPRFRSPLSGLIYDAGRDQLLVFGGVHFFSDPSSGIQGTLRCCGQLDLHYRQWRKLPDMHSARASFHPCWHAGVVFLCGGRSASVETFDPRTDVFTLLGGFRLPMWNSPVAAVAVSHGEEVVVVLGNVVVAWDSAAGKVARSAELEQNCEIAAYAPVQWEGWLYWCTGACRYTKLNLDTKELARSSKRRNYDGLVLWDREGLSFRGFVKN